MEPNWPQRSAGSSGSAAPLAGVQALHFEGFDLLPGERRLLVGGAPVKIGARALDLLMTLVAARDRVVSKDELFERVWPGLVVEENNLSVHVSQLRKLCGPQVVGTVPGRGYQFTAAEADAGHAGRREARADDVEPRMERPPPQRGNMPSKLPSLIGRESELGEVLQMLKAHRWVTISGAGGMGKTRLAEAAGHEELARMPVWIVEFAAVDDPRFVPNAIAQAMGVTIVDTSRPLAAIIAALHGQPTLLILDNCEHLVAAVSQLCAKLLRELPLLRVLVTSQELLHGADEVVYKLGSLAVPDPASPVAAQAGAVQLLLARVRALSRHFEITPQNIDDAVVVCAQLDGLPLAIELAAGRVPMLGLAGVRARLGELLRLLTGDARVRLRRHQTLRAALDWSYQLLSPQEQQLLRRLGAFAGSFGIESVRQIADDLDADEWTVLDTLASLIDKSMVQVKESDRPRYLLLETARAYALEQLAACNETDEVLSRHARATLAVCRLATRQRDTQAVWDEIANIRAAFAWAMRHEKTELAVGLVNYSSAMLGLGGLVGEVVQRLVELEPRVTDDLPPALAAQYWQWLGRFGNEGRLPAHRCVAALERAEVLFRQLSNARHVHACLRMRAEAQMELGDLDGADLTIAAARLAEGAAGALADRMRRLRIEAKILERRRDFTRALERLDQALDLALSADIHRYVATLTQDAGQCLLSAGDAVAAEQRFRAVLDDARRDLSVGLAVAYARMGMATALLAQGLLPQARSTALEAVPLLSSCGILLAHSEAFAWLLAALGDARCAAVLLRIADAFRSASQTTRGPAQLQAYQAARALLQASSAGTAASAGEVVESEAELARLLTAALNASNAGFTG